MFVSFLRKLSWDADFHGFDGLARGSPAATKNLTAETQRPQRKKRPNRLLCELRVSAVKKMLRKIL